jgi:cytochrome P450
VLIISGDRHKKQRKMMNPVFSIKHMKLVTPLFYDIAHRVCDEITKKVTDKSQELDMLLWVSQAALELIGVAGLGHSFETFDESTHPSAYTQAVKEFQ